MARTVNLTAHDGSTIQYVDEMIGSGGMKDVYFSPDRKYVVAFFRDKQDANARDRLLNLVGPYREKIFNGTVGDYWQKLYCWPTKIVEHKGRVGLVAPAYQKHFFFDFGSKNNDMLKIKGKEKEGKWFASASNQNKFLDPREKGNWLSYFRICILVSRAVRRLHAAGLAHSDLSYKNVLVDPSGGNACIIDIDGLVVPGKYPPDVVGTPDFIAPEVFATKNLKKGDPARKLPSILTDRHALAVIIYMYLLYRHPLRGGKIHDMEAQKDEELSMGAKALFVEHPTDLSNRPNLKQVKSSYLPWADVGAIPFTVTGPYLKILFEKAFIAGLHDPQVRPTADEWEQALVKTIDLMHPCSNGTCAQKWFIADLNGESRCPFCRTPVKEVVPILEFFSFRGAGKSVPDNHRLVVYSNLYLYQWHINRHVFPNEKLTEPQRKPAGYFVRHEGKWLLINQAIPILKELVSGQEVLPGGNLELQEGQQLLFSEEDGARMFVVQMQQKQISA